MIAPATAGDLASVRALFAPAGAYLDTATVGLPPAPAWDALQSALEEWRHGQGDFEVWDLSVGRSRSAFARLVGVPEEAVAVGAQVSAFTGLVAASLPDGAEVLCPEGEFTSVVFPFLAQADRRVSVRFAPLAELAAAVDARTHLVAWSAVQSSDGTVADSAAVSEAAAAQGALTYLDATHACSWLPVRAASFDFLSCAGYKWLLAPRGTAFCAFRPQHLEWLRPTAAGWYAGEDVHSSYYGGPLRLAVSARRLDVSPAWFSWVGAAPALELLSQIGVARINAHNVDLANRFCTGMGLPPTQSAIVAVRADEAAGVRLAAGQVHAAFRAGRLRCSFHLYNTIADVERVLDVLSSSDRPS